MMRISLRPFPSRAFSVRPSNGRLFAPSSRFYHRQPVLRARRWESDSHGSMKIDRHWGISTQRSLASCIAGLPPSLSEISPLSLETDDEDDQGCVVYGGRSETGRRDRREEIYDRLTHSRESMPTEVIWYVS